MEEFNQNTNAADKQAADASAPTSAHVHDVPIKAIFNRYDSVFTQLLVPFLGARYSLQAIDKINPFGLISKIKPEYFSKNFAASGIGAMLIGAIGIYSRNTLHDIRSLYSEAVGYELGKNKEDVTYHDIFFKSHNGVVNTTCNAYIKRTLLRMATGVTFFIPWHKLSGSKTATPYAANVDAGTGAIGMDVLVEGFVRQLSFFDAEQRLVTEAIHHTDNRTYETIQPKDIVKLLLLQRTHMDKNYRWPEIGSQEGQSNQFLAERVADLMNQTYDNSQRKEPADLTIGKFNYLVGFGMLDKFPESLAFVELANKSKDMQDVKAAAAEIKSGKPANEVFAQFGIDTNGLQNKHEVVAPYAEPEEMKFRNNLRHAQKENLLTKRTPLEFAAQAAGQQLAL